MTVKEIIEQYLRTNGFDGLFSEVECACGIDDLVPCDGPCDRCRPGYRVPCPPDCGEHEFHIQREKP